MENAANSGENFISCWNKSKFQSTYKHKNILTLDCVGVKKKGSREGENVFSFCK